MPELKKCNSCGAFYPGSLSYCLNDGSQLVQEETLSGMVLDGRYRLDSLIGEGGMGDVYSATHVHIDTVFAVKLLKPEFVSNQTAIKRFRLEAKAAGRIHHPNAIRVTDFGVTPEGIVYLVMEFAGGESLRSLMRREGKFDYLRAVNIVRQICGAIDAAHQSGVIHRDLKPDNILVDKVNDIERVKVLDFGIAKLKETKTDAFLTQAGTIIGTPQYMSPEQCQGKHLDHSSDIYSIGILLYEMLTGEVPFDGETTIQVVYNQLHAQPRPLREISPDVPVPLAQVVMRSLQKVPDQRQSSAIQLSDELRDAVEMGGDRDSLSITDPLLIRPLDSGTMRRPSLEMETRLMEEGQKSQAEDQTHSDDRETSVLPLTDGEPGHIATGAKGRRLIIAIASILLIALAGIVIYFNMQSTTTVPGPSPVTAPEGMVHIPGGKFIMGRDDGSPDEGPAHEVEIKSFFLDIQEVTNREYKGFVDATKRPAPKHWGLNGSYQPDEARYPVTYVSWDDASAYAKWAGKRLPTEKEWEYAARGGSKGYLYPWGNSWEARAANIDRKGQFKPAPVRSFEKDVSEFGIYDMAGNVSEWVQDFYSASYDASSDQRFRVYRGGNFLDSPEKSTNTYRWYDYPALPTAPKERDEYNDQILRVGFRCAKDVERQ